MTGPNETTLAVVSIDPTKARRLLLSSLPDETRATLPDRPTVDTLTRELNRALSQETTRINRRVSPPTYQRYARDMVNGDWRWTGASVQIDAEGRVRDGQHRLLAVIESNTTQDFVVVGNADPASQMVTDVGRVRSATDQLNLIGVANASNVSSVTTLLLRWRAGKILMSSYRPSMSEIYRELERRPSIYTGTTAAIQLRRALPRAPVSVLGALWVEADAVDGGDCAQFFDKLASGEMLERGDPIYALRHTIIRMDRQQVRRLDGRRYPQHEKLFIAVTAWNRWRKNEALTSVRVPNVLSSETFPTVV